MIDTVIQVTDWESCGSNVVCPLGKVDKFYLEGKQCLSFVYRFEAELPVLLRSAQIPH